MLKAEPALAVSRSIRPLHTAAGQGNLELARLLLDHGADPDLDYGFANVLGPYTPLSDAVTGGHFEVTRLLLGRGANPNVSGGRNHDNLFLFAIAYLDARFTAQLLKHGANVQAVDRWGGNLTPLHVAVALGGAMDAGSVQRVGQPRPLAGDARQLLEKSKLLLDAGADVNATADDGATPLLFAAIAENNAACDLLLKHGARLDIYSACVLRRRAELEAMLKAGAKPEAAQPPLGKSLLHWAARSGDPDLAKLVLRHGADPNSKAPQLRYEDAGGFVGRRTEFDGGETPLHIAAALGHTDVVRVLIEHGADLEATRDDFGTSGPSALWLACSGKHRAIVKLLLGNGAKPHSSDRSSPLYPATEDVQIMRLLLDAARDLDLTGDLGLELTASAVDRENEAVVDLLLSRGARLDIFSASALGRTQTVLQLIEANPSLVNAVQREYPGAPPVLLAAQHGHPDLVELLLASGAEADRAEQSSGTTLLHAAAARGHVPVIEVLLAKGFSLDSRGDSGSSLLHAAAGGAQPEVVGFLLSKGADVCAVDWSRETPLHRVAGAWLFPDGPAEQTADFRARLVATARLLLNAGAAIDADDDFGVTPLHNATDHGHVELVELLLSRGADVNPRTARNETPLSSAERIEWIFWRDPKPVAELLRRHGGVK
jgi:serine/threonine-protein phosphatase 6 regulatory ankyrin repeat subunit B